jgi:gliding motility-associated-like protein
MCTGECYNLRLSWPNTLAVFTIVDPEGATTVQSGVSFLFCPDVIGTYNISAEMPLSSSNIDPVTVTLTDTHIPAITSSSVRNCPGNDDGVLSGNNCQKVCEGSTVIYRATNSYGQQIEWDVLGAESYVVNDNNRITVTWGAAGYGHLSATIVPPTEPLEVNCQGMLSPTAVTEDDGSCVVEIFGGEGPYEIIFSLANGMVISREGTAGVNTFDQVPAGTHNVEVIADDGETVDCSFTLLPQDFPNNPCINQPFSTITVGEADDNCCFTVTANAIGGTPPYTYQWSNGNNGIETIFCDVGFYGLTVTDADGCTTQKLGERTSCLPACMGSNQVCIEILPKPEAEFSTSLPSTGDTISVCAEQHIQFSNESDYATTFIWHFGDSTSSRLTDVEHSYSEAGLYELSLIAANECYCRDTTTLFVEVSAAKAPSIECQGTLCVGSLGIYNTTVDCSTFNWAISDNGIIQDGGTSQDSFVIVEWLEGIEGTVTLATSGCATEICPDPNTITVPLMQAGDLISGPGILCPLEQGNFRIPAFEGTDILWSISAGGEIITKSTGSEVVAFWEMPPNDGPVWISVQYDNCYLECEGIDTFWLDIRTPFHLEGQTKFCLDEAITLQAMRGDTAIGVEVDWSILDAGNNELWSSVMSNDSISEAIGIPAGDYIVRASSVGNQNWCNTQASLPISILPLPTAPAGIDGDNLVCPGRPYLYRVAGETGSYRFLWEITDGSNQSQQEGISALVSWGDEPPYELRLYRIPLTGPACRSEPRLLSVNPYGPFEVSGPMAACLNQESTFSASGGGNEDLQWRIDPPEAGSILPGNSPSSVNIFWNQPGTAKVVAEKCQIQSSHNVVVSNSPLPDINYPEAVCAGSTTMVTLSEDDQEYAWYNEQDVVVATGASPQLGAGTYRLEATDADGCVASVPFRIREWPSPTASISTGAYPALCPGSDPIELFAINEDVSYTYRWFRDGALLNAMNTVYTANQTGSYTVEVTDLNGCTQLSAPIQLFDCNSVGGVCEDGACLPEVLNGPDNPPLNTCTIDGNINFTVDYLACDSMVFNNEYTDFLPGSVIWHFTGLDGAIVNSSTEPSPTYAYDSPGMYTVILSGLVSSNQGGDPCRVGVLKNINVPAKALFDFNVNCPGSPTSFTDRSIFLPDETILSWSWDFGDPGSNDNTATGPNVSHSYISPGTYLVRLTIELASGCTSTQVTTVLVPGLPNTTILTPDQSCEGLALPFSIEAPSSNHSYQWSVQDQADNDQYQAEGENVWFTFDALGLYNINLAVTNERGCTEGFTQSFQVVANELEGEIDVQPASNVCLGDSIVLNAPSAGSGWNWSTGDTTASLAFYTDQIISLNIQDEHGCRYTPPAVALQFLTPPVADIQSPELGPRGQTIQVYEDYRSICYGKRVFLQTIENEDYAYSWSGGGEGFSTNYNVFRDTFMQVGTQYFTVTVTDNTTGCSTVSAPFQLDIRPTPDPPDIYSNRPACAGTLNEIYVENPVDSLQYFWTNGATGTTIYTFLGGSYRAYAQNEFGCVSTISDNEYVREVPDGYQVPTGCFEVCFPDTLCISISEYGWKYRWYRDSIPLNNDFHFSSILEINQPGTYWAEFVYRQGQELWECYFTSDPITILGADGYGEILGSVFFDMNNNGMVDPSDSLAAGIPIELLGPDGQVFFNSMTDSLGQYRIDSLPTMANYDIGIDTSGLWPDWQVDSVWRENILVNCGNTLSNNWLIRPVCPAAPASVEVFDLCPEEYEQYQQDYTFVGDSTDIVYDVEGICDSVVRWYINRLPSDYAIERYDLCANDSLVYEGVTILPGTDEVFNYQNTAGCDSILVIETNLLPTYENQVELFSCPDTPVDYLGTTLYPGEETDFTFSSAAGCDSTITVMVNPLPSQQDTLQLTGCEGSSISYAGQSLPVGSEQWFDFQNIAGCDSSILVVATPLPNSQDTLLEKVCPGTVFEYNGSLLNIGDTETFTFANQHGCDSLVTVIVSSYPPQPQLNWQTNASCATLATGQIEALTNLTEPLQFSLDENNWQTAAVFDNLPSGVYQVWALDSNGCTASYEVQVDILPALQVNVPDTLLNCDGTPLLLEAFSNYPENTSWQWPDGSTNATVSTVQVGPYYVSASNQCETVTYDFTIAWADQILQNAFYLPNAFSPNQDGTNDVWRPLTKPNLEILDYELQVFDRWGGMVFYTNDPSKTWDGSLKQDQENANVFVATLKAKISYCGEVLDIEESVDITIVR